MRKKYSNNLIISVLLSFLFINAVNAEYLGCFRDGDNPDLNDASWNSATLTTESCLKFCENVGFSYAGTQSGTQCFCGEQYGNYGQSNDCQTPCAGDANQFCGGTLTNSVYRVGHTTGVDIFTPFTGKIWHFSNERSHEEITFDAILTGDTLFGLSATGQLWGISYNAEDNAYILLRIEEIGNSTNAFSYRFACENCTRITGQYLIIYNINSPTQTIAGPFSADGQLVTPAIDYQIEIAAVTLFTGETWVFNSERSHEEIIFDPNVSESGNLFGVDANGQLWLLAYRRDENNYFLFTLQEFNGKTDVFNYAFTCDTASCERVNGRYFIIYDLNGISETTDGTYSATGQLQGNPTPLPPPPTSSYPTLGGHAVDAFNNPLVVNSTLTGGISVNGASYLQRVEQRLTDSVDVTGIITVDPTHVNNIVNIVVYARVSLPSLDVYYMLDEHHNILEWDLNPASLVAFQRNVPLSAVQTVSMYNGTFIYPGTLEIFFGYQLANGSLISNSTPIFVTIY